MYLYFVENLVDSAAQIVETIWQPPKHLASSQVSRSQNVVLPLRTFIQETLRRSRTSYSTLQVALYYLIVIRPYLPAMDTDVSELEPEEATLIRAKQCGRRMFLAALILASKYLQDRNYSARAWSKISGLNTQEININEMAFLRAVDWKLHISEVIFQKWSDLVLKYTSAPSSEPSSAARSSPLIDEEKKLMWCELVMRLSPDLHEADLEMTPRKSSTPLIELGLPPFSRLKPTLTRSSSLPHVQPSHSPPPRTFKPVLRDSNAFRSLHRRMSTNSCSNPGISCVPELPLLPPPPRSQPQPQPQSQSPCQTPKLGNVSDVSTSAVSADDPMYEDNNGVSAAQSSTALSMPESPKIYASDVSEEVNHVVQLVGCIPDRLNLPMPNLTQRSGLAVCVTSGDGPATEPTSGSSSNTLPKAQSSTPKILRTIHLDAHKHNLTMASPKSTEAVWALNLLREASSPTISVGSLTPTSSLRRKRSCPSGPGGINPSSTSSGVTPRLLGLGGFSSPSLRCGMPISPVIDSPSLCERSGKRARCGWEMDGFDGRGRSYAQGVR